jgi:hypothetical protein
MSETRKLAAILSQTVVGTGPAAINAAHRDDPADRPQVTH